MSLVSAFARALGNRPVPELEAARDALALLPWHLQLAVLEACRRHDSLRYLCALWNADRLDWVLRLTARLWDQNACADLPPMVRVQTMDCAAGLLLAPDGSGRFHVFGGNRVLSFAACASPMHVLELEHVLVSGAMDSTGQHLWVHATENCAYHLQWLTTLTLEGACPWHNAGTDERAFIVEDPTDAGRPLGITRHQLAFVAIRPLQWPCNSDPQGREPRFRQFTTHLLFLAARGRHLAWCTSQYEVWTASLADPLLTPWALMVMHPGAYADDVGLLVATLSILGWDDERIFIGDTWGRVHWWVAATRTHHMFETQLALPRRIWGSPNGLRLAVLSNSNMLQIFLYDAALENYRSLRTIDVEALFAEPRPSFDWRTMFVALDNDSCLVLQDNLTATAMLWMFGPGTAR